MPEALDFSNIDRPYNPDLTRTQNDVSGGGGNGSTETQPVKDAGSLGDVWITNFIKSDTWQPKSFGFYLDGQTGYAEFTNVYVSGTIVATTGTIGGWTIGATELSNGSIHLKSTAEQILLGSATAPTTGAGIFIGKSTTYQFRAGDPNGAYMLWDGSALSIVGGTITAGTIQTAASGARITMIASGGVYTLTAINSNEHTVAILKHNASVGTAVLTLSPKDVSSAALLINIPTSFTTGNMADAIPILINNLGDSAQSVYVIGGQIGVQIEGCIVSLINSDSHTGSGPGVDLTYGGGDYPVIDLDQDGTSTNSYGIRITQGTSAVKDGILITSTSNSHLSRGMYINRSGTDNNNIIYALRLDASNAGTGTKSAGIDFRSGSPTAIFDVPIDLTGAGAYKGRIPIYAGGVIQYIHYFDSI